MLTLAIIISLSLVTGCSLLAKKVVEKGAEESTGADVDVGEGKVKIKTDQGEIEINAEEGVAFPASFPSDFPVYEKAKLTSSIKTTSESKDAYQLTFELTGDWKEAADFYQNTLPDTSYKFKSSMETPGGVTIVLEKNGEDAGAVFVGEDNGKGLMTISLVAE